LRITHRGQEWIDVRPGATLRDTLIRLGFDPQTVLAVRDAQLINEETVLGKNDDIKLISVISGGDACRR
jgi:sulfur carrier protein ThiS